MEDKKISEAIRLLYKGAKMLPYHCPECGTPIFKHENKMICPSCGKEAVFESELKEKGISLNEIRDMEVITDRSSNKEVESKININEDINHPQESPTLLNSRPESSGKKKDLDSIEIQSRNFEKYELKEYAAFKKALIIKLNDVSKMLLDAKSLDEIDRILNLSERILSLLRDIDRRE